MDMKAICEAPAVKTYLKEVLASAAETEEKYGKLVDFFAGLVSMEGQVRRDLEARVSQGMTAPVSAGAIEGLVSRAAQEIGIWSPQSILEGLETSAAKALAWTRNAQRDDGAWPGWRGEPQVWSTAPAMLALAAANGRLSEAKDAGRIDRGVLWLRSHATEWRYVDAGPRDLSIYEASLAVRCLLGVGRADLPELGPCIDQFLEAQNGDGGWDANSWGRGEKGRSYSEAGGTSQAMLALKACDSSPLAKTRREEIHRALRAGEEWLLTRQNADGSWNDGSCAPWEDTLRGQPSLFKTCDGVRGLEAAIVRLRSEPTAEETKGLKAALGWIAEREKIVQSEQARGWGYELEGSLNPQLDGTCLILEALTEVPGASLPLLAANAGWLTRAQAEGGNWPYGDTYRILLALLTYWRTARRSPAYWQADGSTEQPAHHKIAGGTHG